MLLREVIGQQSAKTSLLRMEQNQQLPHALLFLGREGTGGLPLALAFVQFLLCTDRKPYDACGKCANCQKVDRLEHADLHLTFPTIPPKSGTKANSKHFTQEFREFVAKTPYGTTYDWLQFINAENKQGNITAEESREIIEKLFLKSYEGGKKIQIIWRPEFLGKEGNILLKLMEEPPEDTVLILVAENIEDILPTILSRTQLVRLPPISPVDIAQALEDRNLADHRKAMQVGQIAGGSYTEALSLLQHLENDMLPDVRNLFNHLFTNNGAGLAKFADELSKTGREGQKNFIQYVIGLLEQSLRARYMQGVALQLPPEEASFAQKLGSRNLSLDAINGMIKAMNDGSYRIERNAHSKTQLLAMFIKLQYFIQGKPLPVI